MDDVEESESKRTARSKVRDVEKLIGSFDIMQPTEEEREECIRVLALQRLNYVDLPLRGGK